MTGTLRLGRVFGIEINLHWSWAFIFLLITWTFATGILEHFYPYWAASQRWVAGAAVALVFFLSILLHELSHSLVSQRYGIRVTSITLFVFGGVSNLTRQPNSAGQEFRIAIVGPLTSFALSMLFAAGYLVLTPLNEGAGGVSAYLAAINLGLGVFNLVPGFPLDGGRVLRSVLWAQHHSRLEATRLASNVGQTVAYIIMGLGIASFFFVDVITGVWFFLIGNFLRGAATESYGQLLVESTLKGVPAGAIARKDYIGLSSPAPVWARARAARRSLKGAGRPRSMTP